MVDPAKGHAFLIRKLARSEALQRELSLNQRQELSDYLKRQLVHPSNTLQAHVQLQEAGAAFERAGIFQDTLDFYASIIHHAPAEEDDVKQWAKLRWVKTKFRQASSLGIEHQRNAAIKIATAKLNDWQLPKNSVQTAPNYPQLNRSIHSFFPWKKRR